MSRLLSLAFLGAVVAVPCGDKANPNYCPDWKAKGECESNSAYMSHHCRLSCELCTPIDPDALLRDVDTDKSSTMSKNELLARHNAMYALRSAKEAKERAARPPPESLPSWESEAEKTEFADTDLDHSGFLTSNETMTVMAIDSPDMSPEDTAFEREIDLIMFKSADKNNDGLLSPQEYVHYRHDETDGLPGMEEAMRKQTLKDVERKFDKWDTNKDGELDENEVLDAEEHGDLADLTHPDDVKDEL
jgi:Ca2+-binding EF-hand superfamily protein